MMDMKNVVMHMAVSIAANAAVEIWMISSDSERARLISEGFFDPHTKAPTAQMLKRLAPGAIKTMLLFTKKAMDADDDDDTLSLFDS